MPIIIKNKFKFVEVIQEKVYTLFSGLGVVAQACPDVVTRQYQPLFDNSPDQNAVPVRIEKAGLRYNND